jgi:hypothetical protein
MPLSTATLYDVPFQAVGYVSEHGEYPRFRPQAWGCALCGRVNRPGRRAVTRGVMLRNGIAPPPHCTGCGISTWDSDEAWRGLGIMGAARILGIDRRSPWR